MKKFLAFIICAFYLLSNQVCFAVSNLYFVKNANVNTVRALVENGFSSEKTYILQKKNPYLAYSAKNSSDYVVVILQQSSANLFYYFQSTSDKKIDNAIKKLLKKQGLVFEQSQNTNYLSTFEKQAEKVLTNKVNVYDFTQNNQPATVNQSKTSQTQKEESNVLKGYVGQISEGTIFNAYLKTPLNTATASVGDEVVAVLTEDWVYKSRLVAPQGSLVKGHLSKARHAAYGSRNGRVVIDFESVTTDDGNVYRISTEKIDFTITNEGKINRTVSGVAKGAVIGVVGALIVAAISSATGSDVNWGKSMAIGAGVGAGTAAASAAIERGVDAEIPVFTELEVKLVKPLNVTLY